MSCESVRPLINALAGGPVASDEREAAVTHLEDCPDCARFYDDLRAQRAGMRTMLAATNPPEALLGRLRVDASHERSRRLTRITWAARWANLRSRAQLQFDNLYRPFALPVMGGFISAIMMFGLLIPSVSFAHNRSSEPPSHVFTFPDGTVTGIGEFPIIEPVYYPAGDGAIVLLLTIDDLGRVRDYSVTRGKMTKEVQDFILFSNFTPATLFGRPTWGQVRAVFGTYQEMRS
jgi:hypothetical protein